MSENLTASILEKGLNNIKELGINFEKKKQKLSENTFSIPVGSVVEELEKFGFDISGYSQVKDVSSLRSLRDRFGLTQTSLTFEQKREQIDQLEKDLTIVVNRRQEFVQTFEKAQILANGSTIAGLISKLIGGDKVSASLLTLFEIMAFGYLASHQFERTTDFILEFFVLEEKDTIRFYYIDICVEQKSNNWIVPSFFWGNKELITLKIMGLVGVTDKLQF